MAYSTLSDLQNYIQKSQLIQLSNDDPDANVVNVAIVNDAIRRADNLIDSNLKGRFDLPLVTVPESIRDLSIRITTYNLFRRSLTTEVPKSLAADYETDKAQLEAIKTGHFNPFETKDNPFWFRSNKTNITSASQTLSGQQSLRITGNWDRYLL